MKTYQILTYYKNTEHRIKAKNKAEARRKLKERLKKKPASSLIQDVYIDEL